MSGCSFAINNYSGMSIISSSLESLFSLRDSIIYTIVATWIDLIKTEIGSLETQEEKAFCLTIIIEDTTD